MSFSHLRSLDSLKALGALGQLHHLTDVETEVRRAVVVSGIVAAGTKPDCPPPQSSSFFSVRVTSPERERKQCHVRGQSSMGLSGKSSQLLLLRRQFHSPPEG